MLKVLIADDEQLICSMITKMIPWEEAGLIPAGTANNGVEILEKIESEKPDIVITYSIKPNVYAGFLCSRSNTSYFANVQGLGTAFQSQPMASFATVRR